MNGMSNNYNIPDWLEAKVRARDKFCVYCGILMKEYLRTRGTPGDKATFEHIDNDGPAEEWNIAMCCSSCNSSKGVIRLNEWLKSEYCQKKNINKDSVAQIIKDFLDKV